jgi:hypothetical protein
VVLVIRQAQMRALEQAALFQQIQSKLERTLPHRTSTFHKRELRSKIEGALSRGRALGFGDDQLLAYTAFEFVFGEEFSRDPKYPWAQRILGNKTMAPANKMQALREAGIFHLAAEAEEAEWAEQHPEKDLNYAAE